MVKLIRIFFRYNNRIENRVNEFGDSGRSNRILQLQPPYFREGENQQRAHGANNVHAFPIEHVDTIAIVLIISKGTVTPHFHLPHEKTVLTLKRNQQILFRVGFDQVFPGHRYQWRRTFGVVLIY